MTRPATCGALWLDFELDVKAAHRLLGRT